MSGETSTPIFVALNEELGELPEIVVHDFDAHDFDFGARPPASDDESAQHQSMPAQNKHQGEPAQSKRQSAPARSSGGGRRRRKD